jgi:hypothetical protein
MKARIKTGVGSFNSVNKKTTKWIFFIQNVVHLEKEVK